MKTANLLTNIETCERKAAFSAQWEPRLIQSADFLTHCIHAGLTVEGRDDYGEVAGEAAMALSEDRGLDTSVQDVYGASLHHATLADIITSAIRKQGEAAWAPILDRPDGWISGCYLSPDGNYLRRVAIVSSWSDERHYAEIRSWRTWGEIAAYNLPMQQVVCVVGPLRDGKRHSPWTRGFLHPNNRQLRFRKKSNSTTSGFKETWDRVWREEHAEINRQTWLQAMLSDDVLHDSLFTVQVPLPSETVLQQVRDVAKQRLDRLGTQATLPALQLSTCEWPHPCQFRVCCHSVPQTVPSRSAFVPVGTLT